MSGSKSGNAQVTHEEVMYFYNVTIHTKEFRESGMRPEYIQNVLFPEYMEEYKWANNNVLQHKNMLPRRNIVKAMNDYKSYQEYGKKYHHEQYEDPEPLYFDIPSQAPRESRIAPHRAHGHTVQNKERSRIAPHTPQSHIVQNEERVFTNPENGIKYKYNREGQVYAIKKRGDYLWSAVRIRSRQQNHLETTLDDTATAYDVPLDLTV